MRQNFYIYYFLYHFLFIEQFLNVFYLSAESSDLYFYNASVNVPFGMTYYNGRLFVTVPRRNPGIPSTLNVVELNGNPPYLNPLLSAYPNWNFNALNVS